MTANDVSATPLRWLGELGRRHPDAWSGIEQLRGMRGRELPDWPSWCYVPIAAGIAAVTRGADLTRLSLEQRVAATRDAATVTALAAWRQTKGVYVLDADLLEALWATSVTGDLPTAVLQRLPEWCVYLHLERELRPGVTLHGAWVHLEHDPTDGSSELRLVLALADGLAVLPIDLGGGLRDGIESVVSDALLQSHTATDAATVDTVVAASHELVGPLVSIALYLCSDEPEIDGQGRPGNPRPERVKGGWRTFPAPGIRRWSVGVRIGAALRAAQEAAAGGEREHAASGRQRPRAHWRRAHWAVRWTGPRTGEQTPVVRWIQPTLVAATTADEELPAVVRRVE